MTKLIDRTCKMVIGMGFVGVGWVTASLPQYWRLPQAAPSLSSQATEPVARLGPDGLQSTIAGGVQ